MGGKHRGGRKIPLRFPRRCHGVYLSSRIIVGKYTKKQGPNGFAGCYRLSAELKKLGFDLRRFKTGTPARIHRRSIDFSKTERQEGDEALPLSFLNEKANNSRVCHLTYTTPQTKELILRHKDKAPVYNGSINGVGPRYCPSIEDKVIRFADKERHQIFLEPEGEDTEEIYLAGLSSSMPVNVQREIVRTVKGLENAEIMRDAYAIEYDCIDPTELNASLMSKRHTGLFFAGQICGTSGYEEAAGQGLVAGINAARLVRGKPPFVLSRNSSYIGVLIDRYNRKGSGRALHDDDGARGAPPFAASGQRRPQAHADRARNRACGRRKIREIYRSLKKIGGHEKDCGKTLDAKIANRILFEAKENPTETGATGFGAFETPRRARGNACKRGTFFRHTQKRVGKL